MSASEEIPLLESMSRESLIQHFKNLLEHKDPTVSKAAKEIVAKANINKQHEKSYRIRDAIHGEINVCQLATRSRNVFGPK